MNEWRQRCSTCGGDSVPTPLEVAEHLAEMVEGAIYEAPIGAERDAVWSALCRLVAAADVAVARLEGLCGECCGKRLTALDAERAARRDARGAA